MRVPHQHTSNIHNWCLTVSTLSPCSLYNTFLRIAYFVICHSLSTGQYDSHGCSQLSEPFQQKHQGLLKWHIMKGISLYLFLLEAFLHVFEGYPLLLNMLNCKINGTVHIFFLKSHISAPGARNSRTFFSSAYFPLYLHVIIDLGHIWGPFMAKFDKMSKKSAFLVVPDFGYPPVVGAFVSKCWTWRPVSNFSCLHIHVDNSLYQFFDQNFHPWRH